MNGKPVTKNECIAEAKKHNSRGDFFHGSKRCYNACIRHGWIDEVCAHMTGGKTSWTEERVREEALKHNTRVEWKAASVTSYRKARKLGIVDECMAHMVRGAEKKENGYWTEERIREEALKHDSVSSFHKESGGAYMAAYYRGIPMVDLFLHAQDPDTLLDRIQRETGAVRRARGTAYKVQALGGKFCQETAWLYDQTAYEREDRLLLNIERLQKMGRHDLVGQAWEIFHDHQAGPFGNHI